MAERVPRARPVRDAAYGVWDHGVARVPALLVYSISSGRRDPNLICFWKKPWQF